MKPALHLAVGLHTLRAEASDTTWVAETEYDQLEDMETAVAQLAIDVPRMLRRQGMSIRIEPPLLQVRRLTDLPRVKVSDLRTLVAHQSERFFRKNGKPLITDAIWMPGDSASGLVALAVAVEEPVVAALLRGVDQAGLAVRGVEPAITHEALPKGLSLLTPGETKRRRRRVVRNLVRLGLAAAASWVLAGAMYIARVEVDRRRISQARAELRRPLATLERLRGEMRDAEHMVQAMGAARTSRAHLLQRLLELGSALPDSAVLVSVLLSADGSGTMTAVAPRAADFIATLERSGVLRDPHPEGPAARETIGGHERDRFIVRFHTREVTP